MRQNNFDIYLWNINNDNQSYTLFRAHGSVVISVRYVAGLNPLKSSDTVCCDKVLYLHLHLSIWLKMGTGLRLKLTCDGGVGDAPTLCTFIVQ